MEKALIQRDLMRFGVADEITGITPHIHGDDLDGQPPAYKWVAGLTFHERPPLIVKYLKEARTSPAYLGEQHQLASLFLRHGIPTARRLMTTEGRDHASVMYKGHQLLMTLEEDIGPEISLARLALCRQAGDLLGRMHHAVIQEDFHMATGRSIFDWMQQSDVDAGEKLMDLLGAHGRHPEREAVRGLYEARRALLSPVWGDFLRGGVQGDLSINNLVLDDTGTLKVFDYNCAGEAPLISDALLQALLFAREMPYEDESGWDERFSAFFNAYEARRPLTPLEQAWWKPLYQAADAFWFTRYFYGEDTLEKRLAKDSELSLAPVIVQIKALLEKEPPM